MLHLKPRSPQNPEPRSRGDPLVLVDEPAEDGPPPDPRASDPLRGRSRIRWTKLERPVWSLPVVVLGIDRKDSLQVTPAEDQDVIQALSSSRADPALRERVRPWGSDRRLEDSDVFGPEDLVEAPGELRVSIRSRMCLSPRDPVIERFRACWVTQAESGRLVVPATWTRLVESSMKNRT